MATAAAVFLFAVVRNDQKMRNAAASIRSSGMNVGWGIAHFALVLCLMPLCYLLYRAGNEATFVAISGLSIVLGLGAAATAVAALAPWHLWRDVAKAVGIIWCYGVLAALFGASAMQLSQRLWTPTAALTFDLVRRLLSPFIPSLSADAATRILSTDKFSVEISEICSGLEGMGLILAFSAAWLIYFRREYIFPRALLLLPVGLAAIFVLSTHCVSPH